MAQDPINVDSEDEDRQHERPPAAGAPGLGPVTVLGSRPVT